MTALGDQDESTEPADDSPSRFLGVGTSDFSRSPVGLPPPRAARAALASAEQLAALDLGEGREDESGVDRHSSPCGPLQRSWSRARRADTSSEPLSVRTSASAQIAFAEAPFSVFVTSLTTLTLSQGSYMSLAPFNYTRTSQARLLSLEVGKSASAPRSFERSVGQNCNRRGRWESLRVLNWL